MENSGTDSNFLLLTTAWEEFHEVLHCSSLDAHSKC